MTVQKHQAKKRLYRTNEELALEALKYKTKDEFRKNNPNAYKAAHLRNIFKEITEHLPKNLLLGSKPSNLKWTEEDIHNVALKYKTRKEFELKDNTFYSIAQKRKFLNKVCSHMKKMGAISLDEIELFDIIKEKYNSTKKLRDNKVKILNKPHIKGFEIDIFVPELNKGIEFDGTYHHSIKGLKIFRKHWPDEDIVNYHQVKDNYFLNKSIQILHIKEENWKLNKEECIQICLNFLKKGE